jgi:hypothetical protein
MAADQNPIEDAKYQSPVATLATKPFPPQVQEQLIPADADKVVLAPPIQQNQFKPGAVAKQEYVSGHKGLMYSQFIKSLSDSSDELSKKLGDEVYERMLYDPQVFSCFHILKTAILSDPGKVIPAIQDETDPRYELSKEIAEFCDRCLTYLDNPFVSTLYELLDGVALGHKVAEIVFDTCEDGIDAGKWVPKSIRCKMRGSTSFLVDAYMRVIGLVATIPGMAYPIIAGQLITQVETIPNLLPREKFMIFTYNPQNGDPRGRPANRCIYNPWFTKQQAWGEMLKVLGIYGTPSLWGEISELATSSFDANGVETTPQQHLVNVLIQLQSGAVAAVPAGTTINAIPVSGDVSTHINTMDFCDRQIAKGLLGQTLATEEGEHMSRAASETHQDTMSLGVRRPKDICAFMVEHDLFRTLAKYNYGEQAARELTPHYQLIDMNKADWGAWSAIAVQLYQSGYITVEQKKWLDDKLGLPKPKADDNISAITRQQQLEASVAPQMDENGQPIEGQQPPTSVAAGTPAEGGRTDVAVGQDAAPEAPTQVASNPPSPDSLAHARQQSTLVTANFSDILDQLAELKSTLATFARKKPGPEAPETPDSANQSAVPPPPPAKVSSTGVAQYQHTIRKADAATGTYRSNFTGQFKDEGGGNHYFINGHRTTRSALKAHAETSQDHLDDDYRKGWEAVHVGSNKVQPLEFAKSSHAFHRDIGGHYSLTDEPAEQKPVSSKGEIDYNNVKSGNSIGAQQMRDYAAQQPPKHTVRYPEQGEKVAAIEQSRAQAVADEKARRQAVRESQHLKMIAKAREYEDARAQKHAASQQQEPANLPQVPNPSESLNVAKPVSQESQPQSQTESGYEAGSVQDKAYETGKAFRASIKDKVGSGLDHLSQLGLSALHHAGTAEKGVRDFFSKKMEHIPEKYRNAVSGAVKLTYAPYIAANKAVQVVSKQIGMSEPQQRGAALGCSLVDLLAAKSVPIGVYAATGSVAAGAATAFLPVGSMAFLAYHGGAKAFAILRSAQAALKGLDWSFLKNAPDDDAKFGAVDHEAFAKMFADRTKNMDDDKVDLFTAVFCLAMDHSQDPQQSLDAASQAVGEEGQAQFGDYSSTQFDIADAGYLRNQGNPAHDILKIGSMIPDNELADHGRESIPHVTVKYGIHTKDANDIFDLVKDHGVIEANIGNTDYFSIKDADVVILKVHSEKLNALNKAISDGIECTDTHPEYKPHITIAYVKKGLGPKYSGLTVFAGQKLYLSRLLFSNPVRERTIINLKDVKIEENAAKFSLDETISDLSSLYRDVTELGHSSTMLATIKQGIREGANSVYELFKFSKEQKPRAKAIVKAFIKEQNEYLSKYISGVREGQDFPLPSRSSMYAASLRGLFEHLAREKAKSLGARWERRILGNTDHHCDECKNEAARGWQKIGTLAPIGHLQCLTNCGCSMEYRMSRNKAANASSQRVAEFDKIPGGIADKKKPSDFDADDLAAGVEVELEHTSDRLVAREIAMDHLAEDSDYYRKLKAMEAK